MAVVKVSRSGKAVQFIVSESDCVDGTVFQISKFQLIKYLNGGLSIPFTRLTRLPLAVGNFKYPPSDVWVDGELQAVIDRVGSVDPSNAAFLDERDAQKRGSKVNEVKVEW